MKKLISAAVLAVAFCGVATPSTQALGCRCFGLCPHHGCCCRGCCACGCNICIRQYNAFSPVCSGCLYCDGCCPIGGCGMGACGIGGACGPMGCGAPLNYSGIADGAGSCGAGAFTSQAPADPCSPAASSAVAAAPAPRVPQSPIQTAGYRPSSRPFSPTTAPAASSPGVYRPQPMAVPSYWYDN